MKAEQEAKLNILIDTLRAREVRQSQLAEARVDLVRQRKIQVRCPGGM